MKRSPIRLWLAMLALRPLASKPGKLRMSPDLRAFVRRQPSSQGMASCHASALTTLASPGRPTNQ